MTLEEVSARAQRTEIRAIITPTRRQIRYSLNEQENAVQRLSKLWLEIVELSQRLP